MSSSLKRKNGNTRLTRQQVQNRNTNVAVQKLRKTRKNLGRNSKETTHVSSKSSKLELELSPEQLKILSVKEETGQVMIEFRAPSTSGSSIAGTDDEMYTHQAVQGELAEIKVELGEFTISAQSFHITGGDAQNYQTIHGGSTAIKVEDELGIETEDEMECLSPSTTSRSIAGTDDEEHNNQAIQDEYVTIESENEMDIKMEDKIEFSEPSFSVNSNSSTADDVSEGNKHQSEIKCDICWKKYTTQGNLNAHKKRHGKPNFHCTVCGVAKFRQRELDIHMSKHDSNPIYFACDICSKKYSTKDTLTQHRKIHAKPKFHCTVCGVPKFYQQQLDLHMRTHETSRIYLTCEICSTKCSTKAILTKHRKLHGKPNYNCKVCGAAKYSRSDLASHMRTHDTNRIYFACDICSRKCSSKSILNAHRKRHDKPKYQCTVCDVSKFRKYELTSHMKVHNTK